jgi:hypothetical protein
MSGCVSCAVLLLHDLICHCYVHLADTATDSHGGGRVLRASQKDGIGAIFENIAGKAMWSAVQHSTAHLAAASGAVVLQRFEVPA